MTQETLSPDLIDKIATYFSTQNARILVLLVLCVACVLLANPIGWNLARTYVAPGITSINHDAAAAWAFKIYVLGAISFIWAAIERIAMALETSKSNSAEKANVLGGD